MYSKLPSPKIYRLPNEFSGKTGHKSGKLFAQFYFATVCVPTYPCSCVCMFAHTSRSRVYEPLRNNELPPPLRFTTAMQFNPVGSTKRLCPIDVRQDVDSGQDTSLREGTCLEWQTASCVLPIPVTYSWPASFLGEATSRCTFRDEWNRFWRNGFFEYCKSQAEEIRNDGSWTFGPIMMVKV